MKKFIWLTILTTLIILFAMKFRFLIQLFSPQQESLLTHSDGLEKEYYHSGKVRKTIPYRHNRIEGIVKDYYEDGTVRAKINYRNGIRQGITATFYPNGQPEKIYTYKDGNLSGPAKSFDDDGSLRSETTFFNNVQRGKETGYYKNGTVSYVLELDDKGKMQGLLKEYYPSGSLREETLYVNNEAEGEAHSYYEDGTLREIINYHKNLYHGIYREYDRNNFLIREARYENGKLLKEKIFTPENISINIETNNDDTREEND